MGFKLSNKKAKEIISDLIGEGWKAYQTSLYYEIPHGTLYGVNCNDLYITLVIRLDYFKKRVFIASHTNFKNEKINIRLWNFRPMRTRTKRRVINELI